MRDCAIRSCSTALNWARLVLSIQVELSMRLWTALEIGAVAVATFARTTVPPTLLPRPWLRLATSYTTVSHPSAPVSRARLEHARCLTRPRMASLRALSDDSHVVAAADHKNKNTWHHKNDFENVTLSSTRMTLDALDRFCHFARRLTQGPMIVVYSSLMWDIGRLMSADDRFRDIVSKSDPIAHLPVAWTHSLEPWLDAYEANLTRIAAAVQRQLRRFDSRAHGQHASHQTHAHAPASQLVLTGEFGCGMGLMHVCNHVVPLAASRVGRPAATLRVPFVDLHERITGDYILKEHNEPASNPRVSNPRFCQDCTRRQIYGLSLAHIGMPTKCTRVGKARALSGMPSRTPFPSRVFQGRRTRTSAPFQPPRLAMAMSLADKPSARRARL